MVERKFNKVKKRERGGKGGRERETFLIHCVLPYLILFDLYSIFFQLEKFLKCRQRHWRLIVSRTFIILPALKSAALYVGWPF